MWLKILRGLLAAVLGAAALAFVLHVAVTSNVRRADAIAAVEIYEQP